MAGATVNVNSGAIFLLAAHAELPSSFDAFKLVIAIVASRLRAIVNKSGNFIFKVF